MLQKCFQKLLTLFLTEKVSEQLKKKPPHFIHLNKIIVIKKTEHLTY